MDNMDKTRLETLLHQAQLLMPTASQSSPAAELQKVFTSICKLVLDGQVYRELWDEPILSQLNWLFEAKPPSAAFGNQMAELQQRSQEIQRVNNFFFQVLNRSASAEAVYEALAALSLTETSLLHYLGSSNRLETVREANDPPSEKIVAFLAALREDAGLDLANQESVKGCLEALKAREGAGIVNALLVKSNSEFALVVPLQIKIQPGSGQVHLVVDGCEDFEATLERVRVALLGQGFLRDSDDAVCTLKLTESNYRGTSIGLAAAIGMYGAARGMVIDPYTAFTGDINMDREQWRVQRVSGLPPKLEAARRSGCRRVFIPRENLAEVSSTAQEGL